LHGRVSLANYKQGDDLAEYLEKFDLAEAFNSHAGQMEAVVHHLRSLAEAIKSFKEQETSVKIEVEASTHMISIFGSKWAILV
jgi:hypothetical protein